MGTVSALLVLGVILVALFADFLVPFEPARVAAGPRLSHPSARHLFGTDHLGRDLLSRIIAGTRTKWTPAGTAPATRAA